MTRPVQDNLSRVRSLMKEGKNKEALELLEKILAQEGLSPEDRIVCILQKSRLKTKLNDFETARALAEEVLQAALEKENYLQAVDSLLIKTEIAWRLGELDRALKVVEEGEKLLKGMQFEQGEEKTREMRRREGSLLRHGGIIHWYKGDLDKALECHQMSMEIMKELGDSHGMANSLNNLGLVYWSKGDLDRAIEYHRSSLAIHEEIGAKRNIAASLNNLGNVYSVKGELDSALEVYQRSLVIKTEFDFKPDIIITLINMGSIYQMKGELDLALDYYQRSLAISEELGSKRDIALAMNNLGSVHMLKGELSQALEYLQKGLELYQELGIRSQIALLHLNIGGVYRKKGNFEQALDHNQQSLAIYEEMENNSYVAILLFDLLWVALEREDSSLAQQYLKRLEEINKRTKNQLTDQRYRVAKALTLKSSKRARHRIEAGKILEEVIKEEVRNHSLTVTAMIHLCHLLLSELKLTGEEELFGEIKELTGQLLEIAERQSSHSLLAETYLLQSKLALIELDMGRAKKLLNQAHAITEEKGLSVLAREVAEERDSLLSHLKKWESLIKQKPSKQEMVDMTNIDVLLERMIQKTVVTVMEEKGISDEGIRTMKYKLVYLDGFKEVSRSEKHKFRVGIAQIGLSKAGDILHEFYKEQSPGLFGFREEIVETVRSKVKDMVGAASKKGVNLLIFPELTIDLNYPKILEEINLLAKTYKMLLVPGSYHDHKTKQNLSVVISPEGILWEQVKHIPAMIHFKGTKLTEGIIGRTPPQETIICSTEFGRIAITICRDFLDMDLRVRLKNAEPPVDLIVNPAFTPVTADFKAAHFDARRSIYAYCFFANVAEFGDSLIYTPEKERVERNIPAGEEGLIYKEVDLFKLRSERKKWEAERAKNKPFIQSTR